MHLKNLKMSQLFFIAVLFIHIVNDIVAEIGYCTSTKDCADMAYCHKPTSQNLKCDKIGKIKYQSFIVIFCREK